MRGERRWVTQELTHPTKSGTQTRAPGEDGNRGFGYFWASPKKVDALLMEVVNLLAADMPLPRRNFDHALTGEWSDHRDGHVRPDLVLIRKPDGGNLELVRLGSHRELDL